MNFGRIILSCFIVLSLCACKDNGDIHRNTAPVNNPASSGSRLPDERNDDLESTIHDAMTALKNLDMETFNAHTNNRQIMVTPWGSENIEYTLFGELSEEPHTDSDDDSVYQLDREIVKNLSWNVSDITRNKDTAKIRLQITNLNLQGIFQKTESDLEMITEIRKIPRNDTKTIELNLKAEKQNGNWILLVDVDFANAVSADIWVIDPDTINFNTGAAK